MYVAGHEPYVLLIDVRVTASEAIVTSSQPPPAQGADSPPNAQPWRRSKTPPSSEVSAPREAQRAEVQNAVAR